MARVVVLSRAGESTLPEAVRRQLAGLGEVHYEVCRVAPPREEALALLEGASVLAATNIALPEIDDDFLDRLPQLRSVVLYATGYDHLDLDALERHDVTLSVLPEYATVAVAEHALAMIFSLAARVHLANDRARGAVPADVSLRGIELRGRTLGIIGTGLIGSHLSRIARGIGMRVIGYDIDPHAVRVACSEGLHMTDSRDELLAASSVVAVCASTIEGTPQPLSAAAVEHMRPGSFAVCVGRPALVDLPAVHAALRSGGLRGFGIDEIVLEPGTDDDLAREGRLLQTAHSAWWRDEVLARGSEMFGEAVLAAAQGHPIQLVTATVREAA
ncbi:2-hydroxyacid dehydrogenase [Actinomycetota bacterium]